MRSEISVTEKEAQAAEKKYVHNVIFATVDPKRTKRCKYIVLAAIATTSQPQKSTKCKKL